MSKDHPDFKGTRVEARFKAGDSEAKKQRETSRVIRDFNRMIREEGIIQEYRDRQQFVKPSVMRRRKAAAAKYRWSKKQKEMADNE